MLPSHPLSYAQRAKKAAKTPTDNNDERVVVAAATHPPSPSLAVKALSIVAAQRESPIVNIWSLRKEQMAAAAASKPPATHPHQKPRNPSRDTNGLSHPTPPIVDTNSWPEVGKSLENSLTDEKEKENLPHTPKKTKWVPIPPEELQAAADAHSTRSNSRSNTKRSGANGQPQSHAGSGRQSQSHSASHSRAHSRSASVQSSPHLFSRSRRLPDDQEANLNGSNANGSSLRGDHISVRPSKSDSAETAYKPYLPQPYQPSAMTRGSSEGNGLAYPTPVHFPVPYEYPTAGSSTMPIPQHFYGGSGQHTPPGVYSMPQPMHAHGRRHMNEGPPPPEKSAAVGYGYEKNLKVRRGGQVLFGSIANARGSTPSPGPGPPHRSENGAVVGSGGLAIGVRPEEMGVRRVMRNGSEDEGASSKWEFGTTGSSLDAQPQVQVEVVEPPQVQDSPPSKANTNGFSESKPGSGTVSPLVGLDEFSVKDFGFGFGSRRANEDGDVEKVKEQDRLAREREQERLAKEQERLVRSAKEKMGLLRSGGEVEGAVPKGELVTSRGADLETKGVDLDTTPRPDFTTPRADFTTPRADFVTPRAVESSRVDSDDPSSAAQDDSTHSARPRRMSYTGGYTYPDRGRRGGRGTYRGSPFPRGGPYNSSRGGRGGYHHPHQQQQQQQPPFNLSPPPHFQPIEPLSMPMASHMPSHSTGTTYFPPPRQLATYIPTGFEPYQNPQPPAQGAAAPPLPMPLSPLSFPLDPTRCYLLGQLEYYLSPQNMAQDFFLRQRMDSRGWIPIPLIASFNRVRQLTLDIQLVRDVLHLSSIVQVHGQGDWVRMGGWESFVLPDARASVVEEQQGGYTSDGVAERTGDVPVEGLVGESAEGEPVGTQAGSEPVADSEPERQGVGEGDYPHRQEAGGGGGVRDSPDVKGQRGEALSEGNGQGARAEEEEVEEVEEEEEEEDVVFVMGEEAGWSPEVLTT